MPQLFTRDELGEVSEFYTKERMTKMADALEMYLEMVDKYLIFDMDEKEYRKCVKTIRKLIKHLRKGDWEKCYRHNIKQELEDIGYRYDDSDYPF